MNMICTVRRSDFSAAKHYRIKPGNDKPVDTDQHQVTQSGLR
jgi:hypothetical protein